VSITYSAGAGTIVTTAAKSGTVKSFTVGKVRLEDPITVGNNGNLETTIGPVYYGRRITIYGGTGVGQTRYITAETLAQGDGDDVDLDVSEPWETEPDGTSTYYISYIMEDVATLGGYSYITRSGFYEGKNELTVGVGGGTFAWLYLAGDKFIEVDDSGSTTQGSLTVENGGRLDNGYDLAGVSVDGAFTTHLSAGAGELAFDCKVGSITNLHDCLMAAPVADNLVTVDGGTHVWSKGKMNNMSYGVLLAGDITMKNGWTIAGGGTTNDTVQIEDTIVIISMVMLSTYGFESLDDGLTEVLEVRNCIFVNSAGRDIRVHDDKTWNVVNPVGLVEDETFISFETDDLNEVNVLFSLAITVIEPDGTPTVDADCYVYEGLLNQDLPTANRVDTDSNGEAATDVLVNHHTYPGSVFTTATSGNHALKIYEWLKTPFVAALTPDFSIIGGLTLQVTLSDDPDIAEMTQATALSDGSGITINKQTYPCTLLSYDTGTIAFVVGNTVTGGTSGATGIVQEIAEGDITSGRLFLRARNATAFQAGEDLEVSATKNAQATDPLVALEFSTWIDSNDLSLQRVYDYWAATQAEDSISADGITAIKWGEGEHAQIVFAAGGDTFYTERNVGNTDGVYLSDKGAGTLDWMTSDGGTQYVPPSTKSYTLTGLDAGSLAVFVRESDGEELYSATEIGGEVAYTYTYTGSPVDVFIQILDLNSVVIIMEGVSLGSASQSIPVTQSEDAVYSNP
jgi:hypothetical protein